MALGKCQDCGHDMSTTAKSCPNCGCTLSPLTQKTRLVTCEECKGFGYFEWRTRRRKVPRHPFPGGPGSYETVGWWEPTYKSVLSSGEIKKCDECEGTGKVKEVYYS